MDEEEYLAKLAVHLGKDVLEKHRGKLLESAYLAAYHAEGALEALVCDDAPQSKLVAVLLALCWVHEGRHYKKLNPLFKHHTKAKDTFFTIIQTAKKLGVNPSSYILDRVTKKFEMDSLANIVRKKVHLIQCMQP